MASYNGSLDLLALNGAQVFTGIDQKNPTRDYVCVPVDVNDIRMATSKNDPTKQIAGLRVNIWPLNEAYKNAVRRSAQERGDSNVNVPTHEMQMSFSTDYIKAVVDKFPKLVEQVREQNKERDADLENQDPKDENTHLFKLIRQRMNKRLAMLYQPQQQAQQAAYPQQAYATAGNATAYVPPADGGQGDPFNGETYDDDELPF